MSTGSQTPTPTHEQVKDGSVATPSPPSPAPATAVPTPLQVLQSKQYAAMLVLAAIIGVPIALFAYFFLKLVGNSQKWVFTTLPGELGFSSVPTWWPLPPLIICGLIVSLTIRYLPGIAGDKPAEGLKMSFAKPLELPGVFIAALATLALGGVLGPEAPLIVMGGGLGSLIVYLVKRDAPKQAMAVAGVSGAFAAVSALLGNPLIAAFLLLEVGGGTAAGALLDPLLMPGLLAAGIGTLIFVGLDSWTGYGTFSLVIPHIPAFTSPTGVEFLWAIGIGILAAIVGTAIHRVSLRLQDVVERRLIVLSVAMGIVIALAAISFGEITDKSSYLVLFSGQSALPTLITASSTFSVGALLTLFICKGIGYLASLACLRGGPIFPSMFIGATGGIALSHIGGLPMIAGVGMGIAALTTVMLGKPFTALILTSVFLVADGLALVPLLIVAVVVSYVVASWLLPKATPSSSTGTLQPQPQEG
jgi:H+/Cl- antiporter ClcA